MNSFVDKLKLFPFPSRLNAVAGILSANAINNILSFVVLTFSARLLGPAEFAKLSLLIALMSIVSSVLDFGSNLSFVKMYADLSSKIEKNDLIKVVVKWKILLLVVVCLLSYPLSCVASKYFSIFENHSLFLLIALCTGGLSNLVGILQAIEQARKKFKIFAAYNYFCAMCRLSLASVCIFSGHVSVVSIFLSLYTFPFLLLLIFACKRIFQYTLSRSLEEANPVFYREISLLRLLMRYGFWVGITSALCSLPLQIPQFVMAYAANTNELGFYSAGMAFIPIFMICYDAVRTVIFADISSINTTSNRHQYRKILWRSSPIFFVIMFSLLAGIASLQYFILGNQYRTSVPVFLVLGSCVISTMYFSYLNILIHSLGRPYLETVSAGIRILLILTLCFSLPKSAILMSFIAGGTWFLGEFITYLFVRNLDSI